MAKFDMIINPPARYIPEAYVINDQYFTVDTADKETIDAWLDYNGHIITYALRNDHVDGFYNMMPLTRDAGKLFEENSIKEEELSPHHMLRHEHLAQAEYAYVAAIAVKDRGTYISKQCAAALLSAMAAHLVMGYSRGLKKIFANPTTYEGNILVRKLGLRPMVAFKKPLTGNDLYVCEMDDAARDHLVALSRRYARFVASSPWPPVE